MTPPTAPEIKTGLVRVTDLQLGELLAVRNGGDSALEHCVRRVVAQARSHDRARVAAFNAAAPRRPETEAEDPPRGVLGYDSASPRRS